MACRIEGTIRENYINELLTEIKEDYNLYNIIIDERRINGEIKNINISINIINEMNEE